AAAPDRVQAHLLAHVHERLVDQDQRREPLTGRRAEEVFQQGLGGGTVALGVAALGVQPPEPLRPRELEGEGAPRGLSPPGPRPSMPFSASSLSKARTATWVRGGVRPMCWRNSCTEGRSGRASGSRTRW